jgi:hypothetical protein
MCLCRPSGMSRSCGVTKAGIGVEFSTGTQVFAYSFGWCHVGRCGVFHRNAASFCRDRFASFGNLFVIGCCFAATGWPGFSRALLD